MLFNILAAVTTEMEADAVTHEPGVRIIQCAEMLSVEMLHRAIAPLALIRTMVAEVIKEVPGADFIEIRAIQIRQGGRR